MNVIFTPRLLDSLDKDEEGYSIINFSEVDTQTSLNENGDYVIDLDIKQEFEYGELVEMAYYSSFDNPFVVKFVADLRDLDWHDKQYPFIGLVDNGEIENFAHVRKYVEEAKPDEYGFVPGKIYNLIDCYNNNNDYTYIGTSYEESMAGRFVDVNGNDHTFKYNVMKREIEYNDDVEVSMYPDFRYCVTAKFIAYLDVCDNYKEGFKVVAMDDRGDTKQWNFARKAVKRDE